MKPTRIGLIAALVAGVMLAGSAVAQDGKKEGKGEVQGGRPGGKGGAPTAEQMKERMDKMSEELKLSAEQKTKFEAAMKERFEAMKDVRQNSSLSNDEKREKAKAATEALDKKVKGFLSAEQYAKWEKMPGPGRGGPGGPGGTDGKKGRDGKKGKDSDK